MLFAALVAYFLFLEYLGFVIVSFLLMFFLFFVGGPSEMVRRVLVGRGLHRPGISPLRDSFEEQPSKGRFRVLTMELLNNLYLGFSVTLLPVNLLFCFIGVFLGTLVGVLPGSARRPRSHFCCPLRSACGRNQQSS